MTPEVTVPVVTAPEAWRQSRIAMFDACPLSLRFELTSGLRQAPGEMGQLGARGVLAHRFFARSIDHMRRHGEQQIDVAMAMDILADVIAQRDVPADDVVHLRMEGLIWLRILASRWAHKHKFSIDRIVDVDGSPTSRLYADIDVRGPDGRVYQRTITGVPDLLLEGPADGEATILDWKAQPLDAKILTPTGWRRMGDLAVGDSVIGADGGPTRVVGVYPQGVKDVYEVEFTDGSRTECCDEHLWSVRKSTTRWAVKPLSEIRSTLRERTFWQVPAVEPVRFDASEQLPVDPYLLGALLGDGNLRAKSSIRFATGDAQMLDFVREALPDGVELKPSGLDWVLTGKQRGWPNPLRRCLGELGLLGAMSWDKHVPDVYMTASVDERLALLRGLMDTDGHMSREGNRVSYCSASRKLAEQVRELVWSLGGRATLKTWAKPPHRDSHAVYFRLPVVPFRLDRKAALWAPNKLTMSRAIRSVRLVGGKVCRCIKVAAADGLYVTDNYIVTHNTGFAPPSQRRNMTDAETGEVRRTEGRLSDMGYVQQIVYGWLVLRNYPSIQKVTEREYYVLAREDPVREASVERWEIERIEDVLSSVVARMDAAVEEDAELQARRAAARAAGKPVPDGRWFPVPGTHCGFCPGRSRCPIRDEVGIPATVEDASRLAREWHVAAEARKERTPFLKGWVDAHGPVPIAHAKGRRVVGYRDGGRTLALFEPKDAAPSPFDEMLAASAVEYGILETDGTEDGEGS